MTTTLELTPIHDSHKSFYRKALVITDENGNKFLQSYSTIVCGIIDGEFIKFWSGYSATTMRHINEFCLTFNVSPLSKKEWEKLQAQ